MVEQQTTALVVGVVVSTNTVIEGRNELVGTAANHVRHVLEAVAFFVHRRIASRRDPLVGRAVTDPRRQTTVHVNHRTVIGIRRACGVDHRIAGCGAIGGQAAQARAHQVAVNRHGQIIACTRKRQFIEELDTNRTTALSHDHRAEVMVGVVSARYLVFLVVATQACRHARLLGRQIRVHLLGVLLQANFVVVGPWKLDGIRYGNRNVLPKAVLVGRCQTGHGVLELAQRRADRKVGNAIVHRRVVARSPQGRRPNAVVRRWGDVRRKGTTCRLLRMGAHRRHAPQQGPQSHKPGPAGVDS